MSKRNLCFAILYAGTGLLFYLVTATGWHLFPNGIWGLYSLIDGAWSAWHATSIFTWGRPFDLSPYNFLEGLGSLYPAETPWLNPGALALLFPGELSTRYYLSYSIYFLELLTSTVLFGHSLGLSLIRSTVVAELLCLIIFPPYSGYFFTLPYISLGPFYAHLMSMFVLLLALFQILGRAGTRNNILIVLAMIAVFAVAVYTSALKATTFVPVYALFGVAVLTYKPTAESMRWKLGTVAGLLLLSYLLGFPEYYIVTAKVSLSDLLHQGITALPRIEMLRAFIKEWNAYDWCALPQAFICSDYPIFYFHVAAFAGAAMSVVMGHGLERRLAFAMLLLVLVLHVWPVAARVGLLGKFARISTLYFSFAAYPFYAYFAVSLFGHLARLADTAMARQILPHSLGQMLNRTTSTATPHSNTQPDQVSNAVLRVIKDSLPICRWGLLLAIPATSIGILYALDEPRLDVLAKNWLAGFAGSIQRAGNSDLVEQGGREILRINDNEYPVQPGPAGFIEHVHHSHTDTLVTFTGWAIDEENVSPASDVLIYVGTRMWVMGKPDEVRPDVAALNPKYLKSGFKLAVFEASMFPLNRLKVRAFAIMKNGMARELNYSEGYPFSTTGRHIDTHFPPAAIQQPPAYLPPAAIQKSIGNIITETLEREIGLQPGATFRGFATIYFGGREGALRAKLGFDLDAPFSPEIYVDSRFYMQAVYGNSFMTTDLWALNIPTLNEYGQWITQPFYVFAKEMFATMEDRFALHEINLYRLNLKFLQALGVRFLISDAELYDPRLRLRATLRPDPSVHPARPEIAGFAKSKEQILSGPLLPVFLYEVTGSNHVSFSPTNVHYARTAVDILQILKNENFDPSAHVVLNERLPDSKYYPAIGSSLSVYRGHLRVKARSEGASILLLPVQFSHCLSVNSHLRDTTPPTLMRANLVQSAIVFEHALDADLSFVFGPGTNVGCRQADVDDYTRLDFAKWNSWYDGTSIR